MTAQNEILRQEKYELKVQIDDFEKERKQLYCTIAASRRERDEAKQTFDQTITEIDELSNKIQILTIQNNEIQESFQQIIDQKQKEIDGLKQEKIDCQCELGQRQQDLTVLRQENETVHQQLVRQEQIIASLREDKENLQRYNQHCSKALEQAQRKLEHQNSCLNISEEDLEVTKLQLGKGAYGG